MKCENNDSQIEASAITSESTFKKSNRVGFEVKGMVDRKSTNLLVIRMSMFGGTVTLQKG